VNTVFANCRLLFKCAEDDNNDSLDRNMMICTRTEISSGILSMVVDAKTLAVFISSKTSHCLMIFNYS